MDINNDPVDILFVEDDLNDAELTLRLLKKHQFTEYIFHVKDGEEALNFIFCESMYSSRVQCRLPRLILLDLKMPKISGVDVLIRLKSEERTKLIPVVVLTSSKEEFDISECYKLGINSYIVKPVDYEAFKDVVSQIGIYWMLLNQPPGI